MNDNQRDDLWDRLTDAALREALGGKRPGGHKAQVGSVTPGSRAEKSRGAGAGKGKRPTSAERAPWMRADAEPRGSAFKVLVVSTCLVVGLALVVVLNQSAGDRPWFWPVAKSEIAALEDAASTRARSENDLRQLGASVQLYNDSNDGLSTEGKLTRDPVVWLRLGSRQSARPVEIDNAGSGTQDGEQRGGSAAGGGQRGSRSGSGWAAGRAEGFAKKLPAPRTPAEAARVKQYLESVKGVIKEPQEIDDMIVLDPKPTSQTPSRVVPARLPPGTVAEAKPERSVLGGLGGSLVDGTENTILLGEKRIAARDFEALVDVIRSTVKPDSWKDGGNGIDMDGDGIAAGYLALTGKEASPEVVKKIAERLKDGRGEGPGQGGDRYQPIYENRFLGVGNNPLSTFSIDVDTASYSKVRRILFQQGELPPPDAVRLEEFVNYHVYHYAGPEAEPVGADSRRRPSAADAGSAPGSSATGVASYKAASATGASHKNHPFAVHGDVAGCPWQGKHKLLRIAIKGREIKNEDRPPSNLVFLVDVSGSMNEPDRLPLVKKGLKTLVQRLRANDRVAIVVYAGAAGLVLPSTPGNEKAKILGVLDSLKPEGSTNGAQGIQLAYDIAAQNFIKEGTNRLILATDGDFNVGTTDDAALVRLVEERAKGKVFLTTMGFGIGNHNDSMLEQIADKGNGQCFYIDSELEAYKVFVEQLSGTLVTIAKDVKIQVEFNPAKVAAYRLLGYENRMLKTEDFKDDTKDAGEIGAGHTVTALYEIVPVPSATGPLEAPPVGEAEPTELKYQKPAELTAAARSGELLTVHLRYKQPDADKSQPLDVPVKDAETAFGKAPGDFQFAAAVASFGMLLRNSQYRGTSSYDNVLELAKAGLKDDEHGYRAEFVDLVKRAKEISEGRKKP